MADKTPEETTLERIDEVAKSDGLVLDLSSLNLTILPSTIGKLTNLIALDISHNKIPHLPKEIGNLSKLQFFDLRNNLISFLPPEIGNLSDLVQIDASSNQLVELPKEIGKLKKLEIFQLRRNLIKSLPPEIGGLIALKYFGLGGQRLVTKKGRYFHREMASLSDYKKAIQGKKVLQEKEKVRFGDFMEVLQDMEEETFGDTPGKKIFHNHLLTLPKEIKNCNNLLVLSVAKNKLEKLPRELLQLENLQRLDLAGNNLHIPPEILKLENDASAVLQYYFNESNSQIKESKILFIGQGGNGKTSLVRRLLSEEFDANENKTEGISIHYWKLNSQTDTEDTAIRLNIWDFGGQEVMHATHQFFLTKRSLYLLVLDARLTQEENRVEYWLKIIQSFGGVSPVLVVGNKIDQHPLDIDRTGLQRKYPKIVGIHETSAATGAGIEELKAAITEQVNNLPHVRDMLPKTWFTVKTKLEELGKQSNFITHDKYLELCGENEVSDETSQRTLIGFLHDLGVVLHFQDDPRLESLGILNPQWVTNGVYKILNSQELFNNKGVLTLAMLNEILNIDGYPRDKRLFIVDMMKKFELCYNLEPDKSFLVPDLLPKDQPELKFNGIPAFEYSYPVLPSSVITRFIVRMNQKIDADTVWRTGVLLKIGDNRALVKADLEDRRITIAIDGLEHTRRDALSAIRYQLDEIHASIKGLNPQKRVPVPNAPNAEPLEYDYLLMLEREGQETHLVKDGVRLVKVNVREILSGIESEAQRRETGGNVTNIYVGGNLDGSLTVGNDNVVIRDSYNKIKSATIDPELKETLKLLTEAVAKMNQELPDDQAEEVAEDLGKLVDEATKPKPNKRWYSVSIEGLIQAAENLDKLGEPVISLSKKVLSLLTGGAIK